MLVHWLAARKPNNKKKKIKALQKAIDELNKALEINAKAEKYFLKLAASHLESAREQLENANLYGAHFKLIVLSNMQRKNRLEEMAKEFADRQPPLLEELVLLESLKKREIEALQEDGVFTRQKKRHFCLLF